MSNEKEWEDPIVAEIHAIREAHAKRFNYNLDAIFQDHLKKQSELEASGWKLVRRSPKRTEPKRTGTNN